MVMKESISTLGDSAATYQMDKVLFLKAPTCAYLSPDFFHVLAVLTIHKLDKLCTMNGRIMYMRRDSTASKIAAVTYNPITRNSYSSGGIQTGCLF